MSRQYKLLYYPGTGSLPAMPAGEDRYWRQYERTQFFEADNDYAASRVAERVGLRTNSDGVELLRLDQGGKYETKCYIIHPKQPEAMCEGDL